MALVVFRTGDGAEVSRKLLKDHILCIGRDPSNDLVLPDAKVSRRHAEIAYEKGFFVLHDLSSANGSFVNGRKIRVAPLINGAELRFGNTTAVFTEELPDEPISTVVGKLSEIEAGGAEAADNATSPHSKAPDSEKLSAAALSIMKTDSIVSKRTELGDEVKVKTTLEVAAAPRIERPRPTAARPSPAEPDARFRGSRYMLDPSAAYDERSVIRDEAERPLLYYQRPLQAISYIAVIVAMTVLVTGAAGTIFLATERNYLPAAFAAILTGIFAPAILMLVPRKMIPICADESLLAPVLTISQESKLSFPGVRLSLRLPDGSAIAMMRKPRSSLIGRTRWLVRDKMGFAEIARAVEESWIRAVLRKTLGMLVSSIRTNFRLLAHSRSVGAINRRTTPGRRTLLDLSEDAAHTLDRRIALALAVVVDSLE